MGGRVGGGGIKGVGGGEVRSGGEGEDLEEEEDMGVGVSELKREVEEKGG